MFVVSKLSPPKKKDTKEAFACVPLHFSHLIFFLWCRRVSAMVTSQVKCLNALEVSDAASGNISTRFCPPGELRIRYIAHHQVFGALHPGIPVFVCGMTQHDTAFFSKMAQCFLGGFCLVVVFVNFFQILLDV